MPYRHRNVSVSLLIALWLATAIVVKAAPPTAEPAKRRYRYHYKAAIAVTVNGRIRAESLDVALTLLAQPRPKTNKGIEPVLLHVGRIQASAKRLKRTVRLDTNKRPRQALAMYDFAPWLALKQAPLELRFDINGRLLDVAGAEKFQAKIDELLKKDFAGSEEYEHVSPYYLAKAGKTALRKQWRNVLRIGRALKLRAGKPRQEKENLHLIGSIPSESWLGTIEASMQSAIGVSDETKDRWRIESTSRILPSKNQTTKLGANPFRYSVDGGSGVWTASVDRNGWVLSSERSLTVNLSGRLMFDGKNIPLKMVLRSSLQLHRLGANR